MKIIALEHEVEGTSKADFGRHLTAETIRVMELLQSGELREIYFRGDHPVAVLFLECETVARARDLLDTLPLVQAGLITFEVIPLQPYPGYLRLLRSQNHDN